MILYWIGLNFFIVYELNVKKNYYLLLILKYVIIYVIYKCDEEFEIYYLGNGCMGYLYVC